MKRAYLASAALILLLCSLYSGAQQTLSTNTNVAVPPLMNFSGALTDVNGKPMTGVVGVTFLLYKDPQGGSPLWMETQNVQPDNRGHYTVMLGSTSSTGLPSDIFVAGEAHWLAVQIEGQTEQPRVLLVSAPYALKAGDAETIGGLPASAFVLAAPPPSGVAIANASAPAAAATSASGSPLSTSDVTTTGGAVNAVPLFTTSTNIQNSLLTQTGTTAISVAGKLNLPATGTATATKGFNSQPHDFIASAYNSSSSAAVAQTFQLQAEPSGNDTASPSGTLNILYGSGTATPAETGLKISSKGLVTFATGQTFPGTGRGTITGVTAGTDLTGGGTSGSVTLNVDTTKIPSLNSANTFVGNQAITGNLTDTGNITATGSLNAASGTIANTTNGVALTVTSPNAFTGINVSGGTAVYATGYNTGVFATATTASNGVGVSAITSNGIAVQGQDNGSGTSTGVLGLSASPTGVGVEGEALSSSNNGVGVLGTSAGPSGMGVAGRATSSSASEATGVFGTSSPEFGIGVWGDATGIEGIGGLFYAGPSGSGLPGGNGVLADGGDDTSSAGYGGGAGGYFMGGGSIKGTAGDGGDFIGGLGAIGGDGIYAVAGSSSGSVSYPTAGVVGLGPFAGSGIGIGPGVFGNDTGLSVTGSLHFLNLDIGVWGDVSQPAGSGATPIGVAGTADDNFAVFAGNNAATFPTLAVENFSESSTAPAIEATLQAVGGYAWIGGDGCFGTMGLQLGLSDLNSNCENYTLQGDSNGMTYLNASGSSKIAFRINNVTPSPMILNNNGSVSITSLDVTSSLTKPAGSFKIDHPLDPANKYLYHSFVESPDMKNIYDGDATTDVNGLATVTLPDWFQALNRDFRYQLTVIGQFAQAIVAQKIENNQFQIRTSSPNVEVSWQITGIRQDAFANAHRIQTEVEKAPADRGHYLHPELFGAPETARIGYEPPSKLAPVGEKSASVSERPSSERRPHQLMRPKRPLPALPKLPKPPEVKTPPKPTTARR